MIMTIHVIKNDYFLQRMRGVVVFMYTHPISCDQLSLNVIFLEICIINGLKTMFYDIFYIRFDRYLTIPGK